MVSSMAKTVKPPTAEAKVMSYASAVDADADADADADRGCSFTGPGTAGIPSCPTSSSAGLAAGHGCRGGEQRGLNGAGGVVALRPRRRIAAVDWRN
jgi:hypothetical protein